MVGVIGELTWPLLTVLAFAGQSAATVDSSEAILSRASRAYEEATTLQADFVQKIDIPALEQTKTGRGVVYQKKPNYFLMKFEDPAGDVVVADGKWFWMYYPSAQPDQVIRTAIDQASPEGATLGGRFLENPTARYVATYVRRDTVDGRPAYLVSLVPKFDAPYTLVRVWIDAGDYLVRQFEVHEENGTVRTMTLTHVKADVSLPDRLFRFSPPAGVQVFTH